MSKPIKCLRLTTLGMQDIVWPNLATYAKFRAWGGGSSGGGSSWAIYGGAGASGCYVEKWLNRPTNGITKCCIREGGAPVPAGHAVQGNDGGITDFSDDTNGYWGASGATGGQQAATANTGGDGGSGGVPIGDVDFYVLGGMGQASIPNTFPIGAAAPCGGRGGNNNQGGMELGGGAAPGNTEFDSGKGGQGGVFIEFYAT